ncbi:hypothetical protein CHCC20441_3028 [Bacillus licheniformis]|uniref:Uncharacterized protein n=1 Tax=Bacillus paralicheniformis TaxID=1648923 RepID=A0ABY3FVE8_9BACI|nr:hypothetical protein B4125_0858 [Bacillus paralicheniformis]TWJ35928.1 hypothetical protein CHCC5026_3135 [Bacillus licheniformis]TWN17450.1 hypothetical protein CHCC14564_2015 [Bacillus licheniformis LMG 17339]OLG09314.1 hypothetical protein B4123_3527 [Bacillus paralicheniformis]TWJ56618.1 hypothetical protein CHCC5021_2889 [Bacillus paralicheniformis]
MFYRLKRFTRITLTILYIEPDAAAPTLFSPVFVFFSPRLSTFI